MSNSVLSGCSKQILQSKSVGLIAICRGNHIFQKKPVPRPPKKVYIYRKKGKPKSLGRAPSKGYDYFNHRLPTEKDLIKSFPVYTTYNRLLRSLTCSFQEEAMVNMKRDKGAQTNEMKWNEEAHHQLCLANNDAENERLIKERLSKINFTEIFKVEGVSLPFEEPRAKLLSMEKESEEWVDLENMMQKIEEAIDNPINFNFCVDNAGIIQKRTAQTV